METRAWPWGSLALIALGLGLSGALVANFDPETAPSGIVGLWGAGIAYAAFGVISAARALLTRLLRGYWP